MSFTSPVYILPDDVIYGVLRMAYVHSTFPYCKGGDRRPRFLRSPIPFSHVSRHWRGLALSMPSLWSCIHFDQLAGPRGDTLDFIKTNLTRSGQVPLSIHFRCYINFESENGSPEHECPCFAAWNILLEERARWERCVVDPRTIGHAVSFTRSMNGGSFPALRCLQLPIHEAPVDAQNLQFTAPNLSQLRVSGPHYVSALLRSAPLQLFSNLVVLELSSFHYSQQIHIDHFIAVLGSASATLQVLVLRDGCFDIVLAPASLRKMPANFPRLSFLVIEAVSEYTNAEYSVTAALCRAARALERLHIVGSGFSPIHGYLHSGELQLPSVRFLRYYIPEDTNWNNLIPAFPRLEEIQVSGGDPTDMLRSAMGMDVAAARDDGVSAWPHLTTLVLFNAHEYIAVRFVQHRARSGYPLSSVTYAGWFGAQAEQTLKALAVAFIPLRKSFADGEDYTKDWIEYWRVVSGELISQPKRARR